MINTIIKVTIIYLAIIPVVRLMGKRQIGELQPSELVITILLSEVAALTLQNPSIPLTVCVLLIFLLACYEVFSSEICLKIPFIRNMIQGNPIMIIRKGKIIDKNLRLLRFSVEDMLEALRLKDVYDINAVDFAYVETNGSISVKLKKDYKPPTKASSNTTDGKLDCIVIGDGKIIYREFKYCNMTADKLKDILKNQNINPSDILLMTANDTGEYKIIRRNDSH